VTIRGRAARRAPWIGAPPGARTLFHHRCAPKTIAIERDAVRSAQIG
jgi:hypothetical protein